MVAPACFGITLPSLGSVPSAFWEMLKWAVDRILWMGVLCLVTWCARTTSLDTTSLLKQLFILLQKQVALIYNLLLHEFKLKSHVIRHSNYVSVLKVLSMPDHCKSPKYHGGTCTQTVTHSISCLRKISVQNPPRCKKYGIWVGSYAALQAPNLLN
jgi:hypothetical protein